MFIECEDKKIKVADLINKKLQHKSRKKDLVIRLATEAEHSVDACSRIFYLSDFHEDYEYISGFLEKKVLYYKECFINYEDVLFICYEE